MTATVEPVDDWGVPTGTVTFSYAGGPTLTVPLDASGTAVATTTEIATGPGTITATYNGDGTFAGSMGTVAHTVDQAATVTSVSSAPNPSVAGQPVIFTANVSVAPPGAGTPTGTVTFSFPGGVQMVALNAGQASVSGVPVLTGPVIATYHGNSDFGASTASSAHTVAPLTATITTVSASSNPSTAGQAVTFTATVASVPPGATPTGTVTFAVPPAPPVDVPLVGGQATHTTSSFTPGIPQIVGVLYNGDGAFAPSVAAPHFQTVSAGPTTTTITASANPSLSGQPVTFTAHVAPVPPATGTPAGTVTFTFSGGSSSTVMLDGSGNAAVPESLASGSHTVTATYNGDPIHAASTGTMTQVVSKSASTTTVNSLVSSLEFGHLVTLVANVSAVAPATAIPTGTVTFVFSGGPTLTGTINGIGEASVSTFTLPPGTYTVTATYNGDTSFDGSTGTGTQTVTPGVATTTVSSAPNPSVSGQAVTLTALVSGGYMPTARKDNMNFASSARPKGAPMMTAPTGTVTFSYNGGPSMTGTIVDGVATVTTSAIAVGSQTITATYNGDTNFAAGASGTATHVVNKAATTITLSSGGASVFGQAASFTASVAPVAPGAGSPTGTVTFFDGATSLGSASISGGQATFQFAALSIGNHNISAVYSGDAAFTTSTSTAAQQAVSSASTSTVLASSKNPSGYTQSVTFTATISAVAPGAGSPSGTVTFRDGSTVLGTSSVNGGNASFSISTLPVGMHVITAEYSGDANFGGSSSTALSQSISKPAATTSLVLVSPASISVGESFTLQATVTSSTGTPTGTVTFRDKTGTLGAMALVNGVATLTQTAPVKANYTVTASYGGDGTFTESTSGSVFFSVSMVETKISKPVLVSGKPLHGESLTFSATVAPSIGNETITFRDNGVAIGSATADSSGNAIAAISSLGIGTHSITASSDGDEAHGAASSMPLTQVVQGVPTVSLEKRTGSAGAVSFVMAVKAPVADAPTPGGTITLNDAEKVLGTATLSAGQATLTLAEPLSSGAHKLVARYSGDTNYVAASSDPSGEQVSKAATTTTLKVVVSNEGLSLTANVVSPVEGMPSGTIEFLDTTAGTSLGSSTLAKGSANLMIPPPLPVGHFVQAVYSGDANYNGSESATELLIVGANSFSNFISDMAPNQFVSLYGQGLSTATGTGESAAGTTVAFTDSERKEYAAQVIFASPTQVNFIVPADIPAGPATVTVSAGSDAKFTLTTTIRTVNPGIASVDGSLAAAQFVVTHEDGSQQPPVSTSVYDETTSAWKPAPPAWGATDQLHLILYATGLRNSTSPVNCSVGTQKLESLYAGPQPDFPGLDQINLRIPESLRSAGTIQVTCTVDGQPSNTTSIRLP